MGRGVEFPGDPVVRTWRFHCWGPDLISGQGTKIPQAMCYAHHPPKKRVRGHMAFRIIVESKLPEGVTWILNLCVGYQL